MAEWIPVGSGFIVADVIRWKEGVFERHGVKQKRVVRIGDRLVTAEVLKKGGKDGWVHLLVRGCETTWVKPGRLMIPLLQKNIEIKRKPATLARCNPERLLWSEESVRAALVSQFLNTRKHTSSVSKRPRGSRKPRR
jgi:hypothetical protein